MTLLERRDDARRIVRSHLAIALAHPHNEAFTALERACALEPSNADDARADEDFASLRKNRAFVALTSPRRG